MTTISPSAEIEAYKNAALPIEQRVADLLPRLTLQEKCSLAAGQAGDCTKEVPRLGIPALKVTDGPHGIGWGVKATCFPTAVSMGATWEPDLVRRIGVALADEVRAKGRHILLGPCINIQRIAGGGRNFETFGEDPYLNGRMAVAYVKGLQSRKIGTSVKHYACNNQEWWRTTISVDVDERALREIYLPAFEAAVKEADPWTVMGAYNKVRGKWCCENPYLLTEVLKREWGFKGLIMSDWGATHSTADAANAGLDLEMPGPGEHLTTDKLLAAVSRGEVAEEVVDDKVRRLLRIVFRAGLMDPPDPNLKGALNTDAHRALAREAAEKGCVLLKNTGVLPLDAAKIKSIAVIGPDADVARAGGGGSSTVNPPDPVSPLAGFRKRLGDTVEIRYAPGCLIPGNLPAITPDHLLPPDGVKGEHGLRGEYFNNQDLSGPPVLTRLDPEINFDWGDGSPAPEIPVDHFSARWTGRLAPSASGLYELGMVSDDGCRIYLNGELIVDAWHDQSGQANTKSIQLEAGKAYDLRVEYYENTGSAMARLGWALHDKFEREAEEAARQSDAAIVVAGLSWQDEGEGFDRQKIELPGRLDEMIERVVAANPNTVVVLVNGTPIAMDRWLDKVAAVLEAWYPGEEGGHAIARVVFGDVNPSGKMPTTFPKRLEDTPAFGNYPGAGPDGVVHYAEGLLVGYRHYDTKGVEPLFPFGHGLSYTTFQYGDLKISPAAGKDPSFSVSLSIENSGEREGAEVVQVYVRDVQSSVVRPFQELKAFRKVNLKPGERQSVRFDLDRRALAFYDPARKDWAAEPGEFEIRVGSSSRDIRLKGTFELR